MYEIDNITFKCFVKTVITDHKVRIIVKIQ